MMPWPPLLTVPAPAVFLTDRSKICWRVHENLNAIQSILLPLTKVSPFISNSMPPRRRYASARRVRRRPLRRSYARAGYRPRYPGIRGRGDYKSIWNRVKGWIPKGSWSRLGGMAGGALGTYLGGPGSTNIGQAAGNLLGQRVAQITGFGDYKINKNSLMGNGVPSFANALRSNRISHKEFIKDIYPSATLGAFKNEVFAVNPGLAETFPWLSQIATNYEEYRFHGLVFQYKSTSSDALSSSTAALGTVMMSSDYNVLNPPFVNKQQMDAAEFSNSTKPSYNCMLAIECDPKQTPIAQMFVRTGQVDTSPADLRFSDMVNVEVATVGLQTNVQLPVGELWVSYDVELFKPQLIDSAGLGNVPASFLMTSNVSGGVDDDHPLGDGSHTDIEHNFPNAPVIDYAGPGDSQTVRFDGLSPNTKYLIFYERIGTVASVGGPSMTITLTGEWDDNINTFNHDTGSVSGAGSLPGATNWNRLISVETTELGGTCGLIFVSGDDFPTGNTDFTLIVTQISSLIANPGPV